MYAGARSPDAHRTPLNKNLLILALLAASAVPYGGLLLADDLGYLVDDIRFVRDNEALVEPGSILRFFTDPTTMGSGWGGIYRPLRTLDFSIDRKLTDDLESETARLRWFHFRNLAYHLVAVLLLYLLLRRWTNDVTTSLLGAAVFGLHPAQVETVAWITSRDMPITAPTCGSIPEEAELSKRPSNSWAARSSTIRNRLLSIRSIRNCVNINTIESERARAVVSKAMYNPLSS